MVSLGIQMKQLRQSRSWLTVKGVADYCLVSKVTVRRWIKCGKLSATRLPSGHYRIRVGDFRDFLKQYDMPIKEELFESEPEEKGGLS